MVKDLFGQGIQDIVAPRHAAVCRVRFEFWADARGPQEILLYFHECLHGVGLGVMAARATEAQ